jgi:integrase
MKRAIKFDLFPQKSDCRPIRARVSYGGKRVDVRVGYSIEVEKWDSVVMRVRAGYKNKYKQSANEINKAIAGAETAIEEIFARFELLEKRCPSPEELKQGFYRSIGKKQEPSEQSNEMSFHKAYSEFTRTVGETNNWTRATYYKFSTLLNHLDEFNGELSFGTLDETTLQGLVVYFLKKDMRNTTVSKYIRFMRWFLRWAYNKGYFGLNVHETFRPKFKGIDGNAKEVIYLEWEELQHLYSFDIPDNRRRSLSTVRDVFCFCCFTGLRYSDVAKLRRSDIRESHIRVVTQKTVDGLIIELNKYSEAILKKYEDVRFPGDLALPIISNQKMNDYLKELGELAGLDEPQRIVFFKGNSRHEEVFPKYALLTTHCGRRTFIVNALRLGVPAEVIMKWTGHSDYNAMKPYIKIVDKLKVSEMSKFNR